MSQTKKKTTDAVEILWRRCFEGKPEMIAMHEREMANARVAEAVYGLRNRLRLSQRKFAEMVGVSASVIAKLEDADFSGDVLGVLSRMAQACGKSLVVEIQFVPRSRQARPKRLAKVGA